MYDPKFSVKKMYEQYGSTYDEVPTKRVDPKPSRSSGFGGMGPDPAERFGGSPTRGLGSKPIFNFNRDDDSSGADNNPNRDAMETRSTVDKLYDKAVTLLRNFGASKPEDVIVDGKAVYKGPAFRGYDPTTRIGKFGADNNPNRDVSPTLPPSTMNIFGVNTDNPSLNMFGVRRDSFRNPDPFIPPVLPESPANMDPMTRTLSQAMLPEPVEPTADYTTQAGDTLFSIQKTLKENGINTTVEELAEINNIGLDSIFGIKPGTELKLPMPDKNLPTEFMDAETKAMLDETTPVKASAATPNSIINIDPVAKTIANYISKMFGNSKDTAKPFTISTDEIKTFAKEIFDPVQAAAFVATFEAETGGGKSLIEKGYSKKRAIEVFVNANKRKDGTLSEKMKERKRRIEKSKNSEEIFNIVYGDRMGNTQPGDGFKYRGRGPIMLTGKNNYKEIGDAIGVDLVNNPDLLITDPSVSLRATTAYLQSKNFQSVNSATTLANVVGHSNPQGKEGIRRWNNANKFYKEMYGKPMPTLIPKQRPAGLMEKYTIPRPQIRPENS